MWRVDEGAVSYWQLLPDAGWGPGFAEQDGPPVSLRVNDALRWGGRGALEFTTDTVFLSLANMPGTLFKTLGISYTWAFLFSNLAMRKSITVNEKKLLGTFFQK